MIILCENVERTKSVSVLQLRERKEQDSRSSIEFA